MKLDTLIKAHSRESAECKNSNPSQVIKELFPFLIVAIMFVQSISLKVFTVIK